MCGSKGDQSCTRSPKTTQDNISTLTQMLKLICLIRSVCSQILLLTVDQDGHLLKIYFHLGHEGPLLLLEDFEILKIYFQDIEDVFSYAT